MSNFDEPDVADKEYSQETEPMRNLAEGDGIDSAPNDPPLDQDEEGAIDKSNIIDERTRDARPSGGYREPGDDEGIPTNE